MNGENKKRMLDFCANNFGQLFSDNYKKVYITGKPEILMYADNFFKKWIYGVLYENINMTVFDIFENLQNESDTLSVPRLRMNNYKVYKGMTFENVNVSLENHPAVDDISVVIEKMVQDGGFNIENLPDRDVFNKYVKDLSIQEGYYVSYLVEIALEMGLIKEMPSINTVKYVLTEKGKEPVNNKEEFFREMVSACIKLCLINLGVVFNKSQDINEEMIYKWIKERKSVDEIFSELYSLMGIDIREVWMYEPDEYDDMDDIIMSTAFYTGIVIDRWFLTPLGHYFQLIKPVYTVQTSLKDDISYAVEEYNSSYNGDASSGFFVPSTGFELTCLGEKFFDEKKKSFSDVLEKISPEDVLDLLSFDERKFLKLAESKDLIVKKREYIFDAYIAEYDEPMFSFGVEEHTTLQGMHVCIARKLRVDYIDSFKFYMEEISPFTEYSPDSSNKNTMNTYLTDLNLKKGSKIIYSVNFDDMGMNLFDKNLNFVCVLKKIGYIKNNFD